MYVCVNEHSSYFKCNLLQCQNMDNRAAKLALARQKLKDHQKKKDESVCNASQITIKQDNNTINPIIGQDDFESNKDNIVNDTNDNFEKRNESCDLKVGEVNEIVPTLESSVNVTEILISSKRNLELQISNLQMKLLEWESKYNVTINNNNIANQTIQNLENDLRNITAKFSNATEELLAKDTTIKELTALKTLISEENSNYQEQLEFTKTILTAKENENSSLHSQLFNLQNQLDATQLQLQQLTNGSFANLSNNKSNETEHIEGFIQKIASLEQQLNVLQKERDQMNLHYEHYVSDLNEQLRSVISRNEALTKETEQLSNRECGLIEQISDLEIRLQNYNTPRLRAEDKPSNKNLEELQLKYENVQENYQTLCVKYEDIKKQLEESNNKVKELNELKEHEHEHDNISISKLTADIASDKIAAQRATEQNKKLKLDIQGLEDAFVKMTKDKLELTEKLTAEKYLNRELTIKLAEIDDKAKDMQIKLKAKDDEMIRLQANCRDLEKKIENLQDVTLSNNNDNINYSDNCTTIVVNNNPRTEKCTDISADTNHDITCTESTFIHHCNLHENENKMNNSNIPKQDAMVKLQERFLKIMEEVADLSDEKHRLEHIILQLQNETETICEYVALYQQQRSLLKRRDEERSAQMEIFESECAKLKSQLEELTAILVRFAEDKELSSYFQIESRHIDIQKIMNLLANLKNNALIDTEKKNMDFKNFHPCNCCSGKLIEV